MGTARQVAIGDQGGAELGVPHQAQQLQCRGPVPQHGTHRSVEGDDVLRDTGRHGDHDTNR